MQNKVSTLLSRVVTINGVEFWKPVEEFTPPTVKKTFVESQGGSILKSKQFSGLDVMGEGSIKLSGTFDDVSDTLGFSPGEPIIVDVKDVYIDGQNGRKLVHHEMTIVVEETPETVEIGEKVEFDMKYHADAYKKTTNSKVNYDIDVDVPRLNLGKGDLLAGLKNLNGMGE